MCYIGIIHLKILEFSNFQNFGRLLFEFSKFWKSQVPIFQFYHYTVRKTIFRVLIFLGKVRIMVLEVSFHL